MKEQDRRKEWAKKNAGGPQTKKDRKRRTGKKI